MNFKLNFRENRRHKSKISNDNNYVVYIHRNKLNNKVYVGCSYNIKERWRSNGKNYANNTKFYEDIKLFGWDGFEHIIIKDCLSREEASTLEKEHIKKYDSINKGYNVKEGGIHAAMPKEFYAKLGKLNSSDSPKNRERIKKIRAKAIGRTFSEETLKKMSEANRKTVLINIDGEIGNIRYWAKRINMTHPPLVRRRKLYGDDALINFIKEKLDIAIRQSQNRLTR